MINSVRYAELGEACLAPKKNIITCSGAPWHAVIEPRRMAAVGIVSPTFYVGRYISAWRIEIRTEFNHRDKKTRPIKGLKLNPAVWRW